MRNRARGSIRLQELVRGVVRIVGGAVRCLLPQSVAHPVVQILHECVRSCATGREAGSRQSVRGEGVEQVLHLTWALGGRWLFFGPDRGEARNRGELVE